MKKSLFKACFAGRKILTIGMALLAMGSANGFNDASRNGGSWRPTEEDAPDGVSSSGHAVQLDYGELLAFPYAEGHGRYTTGGRGGAVYHVTTLEDTGEEGSFSYAVRQQGARTIVFDVSGTIFLKRPLRIMSGDLTIAGQTSPGGICIAGQPFGIGADNVIIRFVRFRPGNVDVDCDGLSGMDRADIIIDHCSVSWGTDECLSVYAMRRSTVQWCLAAQSLRATPAKMKTSDTFVAHGYGGNWGGHYASYHHNLIAHCESRVPRMGPRPTTLACGELADFRNNVYYNWAGEGCYGGEAQHLNIENNYYKPGPATEDGKRRYRIAKPDVYAVTYNRAFRKWFQIWGCYYIEGNQVEGFADVTADNWTKGVFGQMDRRNCATDSLWERHTDIRSEVPVVSAGNVTTHTAETAYERVLAYVGACDYRDRVDKLIVDDVRSGKASCTGDASRWADRKHYSQNKKGYINAPEDVLGAIGGSDPYDVLVKGVERDVTDSDGDGIPDRWEQERGLNPLDKTDGVEKTVDKRGGYTNLEMYLNSLVHSIMVAGNEGGTVVE